MHLFFTAVLCFAPVALFAAPYEEFNGIHQLNLRVSAGNVKVVGMDSELTKVDVVKKRYDERCQLLVEKRNERLIVELGAKSLHDARCEADFVIQVPKQTALHLRNLDGNILVEGSSGALVMEPKEPRDLIRTPAKIRARRASLQK